MPIIEAHTLEGDGTLFTLQEGDTLRVGAAVELFSFGAAEDNTAAVQSAYSLVGVSVFGTVRSADCAVELGNDADDWGGYLAIGRTGVLTSAGGSRGAIHVTAQAFEILNNGRISGAVGINLRTHTFPSTVENNGSITALGEAILRGAVEGEGALDRLIVRNTGTISGGLAAFDARQAGEAGIDEIYNSGEMVGDVLLGAGNDLYAASGGGHVNGWIFGNAGSDVFRPGKARERMDGGEGLDTLDFRTGGPVKVLLNGGPGATGRARGDIYTAFEIVYGSQRGDDWLRGSEGDEQLLGLRGHDRLIGGAGDDQLTGGRGRDTLSGGAGADQFIFRRAADAGDVITDFDADGAGLDRIVIDLSGFRDGFGFGVGGQEVTLLEAGGPALSADQADNIHIIFANRKLWIDVDGKGGQKPVFIARILNDIQISVDDFLFLGGSVGL